MQRNLSFRLQFLRSRLEQCFAWADANWKWVTFLIWVGISVYFIAVRWPTIHWFALGDTDDNMRYLQVRDWLNGQGWFDLVQHRMNPPVGANIHWSRLVDLPIAVLMLLFRTFMNTGDADRLACAIAPLLPMLLLMLSLAFITRRLSNSPAWIVAAFGPLGAPMGLGMYMPLRVDHHGWQLALTVTMLAGIVDRKWLRGGVVAGLASALSVAIGMEMMVYLAGAGGLIGLRWVFKQGAARRMLPYALALGGCSAFCFVVFASYANRAPVCDALSPIWVSTLGLAAAGMVALCMMPLRSWATRLAAGAALVGIIGLYLWMLWPQCLTGAYQISPELTAKWLSNIREAKPVLSEPYSTSIPMLALPVAAVLAALWGCWKARHNSDLLWAWGTVALMILFAVGLTFWQIRAAPAAQLLAVPAAAWAGGEALALLLNGALVTRLFGVMVTLLALAAFNSSIVYGWYAKVATHFPSAKAVTKPDAKAVAKSKARKERMERIRKANARCRTLPALSALNKLPPATIFTLVDLGPRLIATTHHSAISGPYHRNGDAILDIHHAFDGTPQDFRAIAGRHKAAYFLFCPDFPEGTVYQARSPRGFYGQMINGKVPKWLVPVDLGETVLPYTLYRINYGSAASSEEIPQK
jgi:hypothetical protein